MGLFDCATSRIWCAQEHDELEEVATGQQPQKEKEKAGLLSKALRAPLGTRTLSLHNMLDQAPLIEGQQVMHMIDLLTLATASCHPAHCPGGKVCFVGSKYLRCLQRQL